MRRRAAPMYSSKDARRPGRIPEPVSCVHLIMDEHDDGTRVTDAEAAARLRALGRVPLEPDVAQRCATRIRNDGRRRTTLRRAGVIGALAATMVVGSVGLAAA